MISYPGSHRVKLRLKFRALSSPTRTFPLSYNAPLVFLWKQGYVTIAYITLGFSLGYFNDSVSTGDSLALLLCKGQLPFFLWSNLSIYHSLEFIRVLQGHGMIVFHPKRPRSLTGPSLCQEYLVSPAPSLIHRPHGNNSKEVFRNLGRQEDQWFCLS